jgi:hypothetical protein
MTTIQIPDNEAYDTDKATQAMKNMNASAKFKGISEMSLDEINEEISNYRLERRTREWDQIIDIEDANENDGQNSSGI